MRMVGQRIRMLRKRKELTQDDLAEYLNLSKTTISHYERNERSIPIDVLIQIANYFDVDINYLCGINNRGFSIDKEIKLSDDEIDFILELRKTSSYSNMISNPKNYAKLIENRTKGYKVKI